MSPRGTRRPPESEPRLHVLRRSPAVLAMTVVHPTLPYFAFEVTHRGEDAPVIKGSGYGETSEAAVAALRVEQEAAEAKRAIRRERGQKAAATRRARGA